MTTLPSVSPKRREVHEGAPARPARCVARASASCSARVVAAPSAYTAASYEPDDRNVKTLHGRCVGEHDMKGVGELGQERVDDEGRSMPLGPAILNFVW
eukprot:1164948-Pleurochrysis_carterae.AAC.1